jgi:transcription antitermination factor NusG
LFCRFDPADRMVPVLTTPGVTGMVSAGRTPIPVPDKELEAVRAVVAYGLDAQPWPYLDVGSKVSIAYGPLAGLEGVIASTDKMDRFVVSVTLLQRSVAVEIDRNSAVAVRSQERQPEMFPKRSHA